MVGLVRDEGAARAEPQLGSSPAFYDAKAGIYREFSNTAVLEMVRRLLPPGGRVLDIGCASGGLLALLTDAGYRAGVESSAVAAERAMEVADLVVVGDIDNSEVSFPEASFDVVVCADVLEHLPDPASTLRRVVDWVAPGGSVVICVPNIANWRSRLRMLRGQWRYEEQGIWDSGHLRFFTLASLRSMVASVGLAELSMTAAHDHATQFPVVRRSASLCVGLDRILRRLAKERPALFAFQLVSVSRKT